MRIEYALNYILYGQENFSFITIYLYLYFYYYYSSKNNATNNKKQYKFHKSLLKIKQINTFYLFLLDHLNQAV